MITAVDRICQQCDKSFSTPSWRAKQGKGKFCSVACHNAFQKGNPSPTSPQKLSLAQKDSYRRNQQRATNNSKIMIQLWQNPEFRERMLDIRSTSEFKERIREATKLAMQDPELRQNLSKAGKENWQHQSPQFKEKVRQSLSKWASKLWSSSDYRIRMSKIRKELWQNPEFVAMMREVHSETAKKMWQSPQYKQHQIEAQKQSWRDPQIVAKRLSAANKRPNKLEQKLIGILKAFPDFKYNGDFSQGVVLGGFIPDFINVNGKKQVIELFGDYWHSPEVTGNDWRRSELGKIMAYNSIGYRCLVIWEHELKTKSEEQLIHRINEFTKRR